MFSVPIPRNLPLTWCVCVCVCGAGLSPKPLISATVKKGFS